LYAITAVCLRDRISNKTITEKIERRTTVDLIWHRKLKLFGHICRMADERLVKTMMLVMVDGDRPRGRPARSALPEAVQLEIDRNELGRTIGLNGPHNYGSRVQKRCRPTWLTVQFIGFSLHSMCSAVTLRTNAGYCVCLWCLTFARRCPISMKLDTIRYDTILCI